MKSPASSKKKGSFLMSKLVESKTTIFVQVFCASLCLVASLALSTSCFAYSDEQLVNAIYISEGGPKAQYLYGIRSVKYKNAQEARQICLNTIRKNKIRFSKQAKYKDYLEFLASRYCPIGCDNDRGANRFWLKNVRYHLQKGGD